MAWTVEYLTTGQKGVQKTVVTNRIGCFRTKAEAEAYLERAQISTGRAVES